MSSFPVLILACLLSVALGGTLVYLLGPFVALRRSESVQIAPNEEGTPHVTEETFATFRRAVESEFAELRTAVGHGIEHVDRTERRIKSTVRRAERRLDEAGFRDEGVEAEAANLRGDDADARPEERVPDLPNLVAVPGNTGPTPRGVIPGAF